MSLIPTLTNQQAFDTVLAHLIKQGKRAFGHRELKLGQPMEVLGCMYRTPQGLTCAVGCLIPDDLYSEDLEGESIRNMLLLNENLDTHFVEVEVELLRDLQVVHDSARNWDDQGFNRVGLNAMYKVSKENKLTFTMPEGVRI